jgi:uncharacterized protein (TIGR02646 family)
LHQHPWRLQKGLCAYCEQEIPEKTKTEEDKSHLEHIRPKRGENGFPDLTYCFENIIVSCEGFDLTTISISKRKFCGHIKDNQYDSELFLNPTEISDIESYFYYGSEGQVEPHPLKTGDEQNRAAYMIRILGLDHSVLVDMRKNQYDIWLEKKFEWSDEKLAVELNENLPLLPSFFSLLKQKIL